MANGLSGVNSLAFGLRGVDEVGVKCVWFSAAMSCSGGWLDIQWQMPPIKLETVLVQFEGKYEAMYEE